MCSMFDHPFEHKPRLQLPVITYLKQLQIRRVYHVPGLFCSPTASISTNMGSHNYCRLSLKC